MRSLYTAILVGAALAATSIHACSAFLVANDEKVLVGKSYDWFFFHGHGMVYVNPRGIDRTTMIFDDEPNPARWTSKYGSVILTQFGRGTPISGMNEKGLVVELLQLPNAGYNSHEKEKPYVNESTWSQYQLDNYATVAEVVANADRLRIEEAFTGIHYFVADREGNAATVEFVDGKLVVHAGGNLPTPVLTNDTYEDLLTHKENTVGPPPRSQILRTSFARFERADLLVHAAPRTSSAELENLAWRTLDAVRLRGWAYDAALEPSQWNVVHDPKLLRISFKTRGAKGTKTIDLDKLDFTKGAPERMADMNQNVEGDFNTYLHAYSAVENEALVRKNTLLFKAVRKGAKVPVAVEYGRIK